MAETVTNPPAEKQQGAERQRIPGDDPLELRRGEMQLGLDGWERDVDDAEVELEHELGGDHEPERHPQPGGGGDAGVTRRGRTNVHARHGKARSLCLASAILPISVANPPKAGAS